MDPISPTSCTGSAAPAAVEPKHCASGDAEVVKTLVPAAYQTLIKQLPQGVFIKNRDSQIVAINPAMSKLLQRPVEAVAGKNDSDLFSKERAAKFRADDLRIMSQRRSETIEEAIVADG